VNIHIITMIANTNPPLPQAPPQGVAGWRTLPLAGSFEVVYRDGRGLWSIRRLAAHELKLGPGKALLGGTDRDRDGYRGFRADRIRRLTDRETGERVESDVLDWLLRRAAREAKREARDVGGRAGTMAARAAKKAPL
jgi:predicted DNA-binding transcriptional regulator YafY